VPGVTLQYIEGAGDDVAADVTFSNPLDAEGAEDTVTANSLNNPGLVALTAKFTSPAMPTDAVITGYEFTVWAAYGFGAGTPTMDWTIGGAVIFSAVPMTTSLTKYSVGGQGQFLGLTSLLTPTALNDGYIFIDSEALQWTTPSFNSIMVDAVALRVFYREADEAGRTGNRKHCLWVHRIRTKP
jgi:hypothetical protein